MGTKTLDTLLEERDAVADELRGLVAPRLKAIGLELVNLGIRDVILPGDMKVLLNKVIEAQKAAEANLITRREETAAIRSQLNAARILELPTQRSCVCVSSKRSRRSRKRPTSPSFSARAGWQTRW